jgi:integrase
MATWHEKTQRWVATATIDGKRRYFYSKLSEEEAESLKREAARLWKNPPQPTPDFAKGTFAGFVYSTWWPRTRPKVRETTRAFYDELLALHILPHLGHLPIESIGYEEVTNAVAKLTNKRTKKPLGDKRKKEAVMLVRSILKLYGTLEEGRTGRRVRTDWRLAEPPKVRRKKERIEPSPDLPTKLMQAAKGTWLEGPVFCALFLALRRGEICGLKWSAIDRKNLRLKVSEQRHEKLKPGSPTKGKARTLPLTPEILARLDALGDKGSVYLFTFTYDGKTYPIIPNGLTDGVTRLCRSAGFPGVTLHDLRAYAASNLVALGVDLFTVMEVLGHTKLDTTQLYLVGREEARRKALKKLFEGAA